MIIMLSSLIMNYRRISVLMVCRLLLLLLLLLLMLCRVGMSVTHARIVQVVYGWVHMTHLA